VCETDGDEKPIVRLRTIKIGLTKAYEEGLHVSDDCKSVFVIEEVWTTTTTTIAELDES